MVCTAVAVHAHDIQDGSAYQEELNERDFEALNDYLNTKRTISLEEKDCNLTISGDVRTEWRHMNEKIDDLLVRGGSAFEEIDGRDVRISRNDFDIEFNLRFDYVCDRTWAVVQLEYDNSAGVDAPAQFPGELIVNGNKIYNAGPEDDVYECGYYGSGRCDDICLKKAYFGYNICCDGCTRFDVEIGRRNLYNVFDSQVQFLSRFDGILLKYKTTWECVADWYINLAGFLVDERSNHFAWVTEIGFLNMCDWGLDFKYSFIDWQKHGQNRFFCRNPQGMDFLNSQFTLIYNFDPEMLCMPARVFGAFVWNHAGNDGFEGNHHKRNIAWYAGFSVGQVVYEGDWAFQGQYQVVQENSIPNDDVSGIGLGNYYDLPFANTNFRGWKFEALYAVTDNITLDAIAEWSNQDQKTVLGSHHYSKFEIEAIYAF